MKLDQIDSVEVELLAEGLGLAIYAAVGILEMLLNRAHRFNFTDRENPFWPESHIERLVKWDGEKGKCLTALIESGLLARRDDGNAELLHYWERFAEYFVTSRLRMRDKRKSRDCSKRFETVPNCSGRVTEETRNKKQEPSCPKSDALTRSTWFEMFWNTVPSTGRSRSSKKLAEAAFMAAIQSESDYQQCMASLAAFKTSKDWTKDNGTYIPGIHRWIKDGRWQECPQPNIRPGEDASMTTWEGFGDGND